MKINKIIAGIFSICIMIVGENFLFSFTSYSIDKNDLENITLPDIDWDSILEQSYEFTLKNDGTYEISKYIYEVPSEGFQSSDDITLPSSYKGKPVTSIGYKAFCTNNADHITGNITIPQSITSIGNYAFWMCDFNSCVIPESVTSIGIEAFNDTPWLDIMRKQNPLVIINNILIDARTVKGDVIIPDGLTAIPDFVFYKNEDVTGVTIPDSVKIIGNSAFEYCSSLSRVNLPDSLTGIGDFAFAFCENLSGTFTIPSGVETIGSHAFRDCRRITEVIIKNGVTEIGNSAFSICLSLENVNIPNSVKTIGNSAFSETHSLKSIVIPSNVASIGKYCFQYSYILDSVTIENSDCEIYDESSTFPTRTTIYGHEISTAQSYAEKYNRKFVTLDQTINLGDLNNDKIIDSVDASMVLAAYSMLSTENTPNLNSGQLKAADVNSSGTIDAVDASFILSYYSYVSTGGTNNFETFLKDFIN
ncbi:MAG: leucine-rich repeat protein [Ruminococcus sp.]|nr:leucine-rich repeat protein [Ruminococcus sp.]